MSGVFSVDLGCLYKQSEHLRQQMGPTQHAELRQRAEHLFLTNEDARLHLCIIAPPPERKSGPQANRKKKKRTLRSKKRCIGSRNATRQTLPTSAKLTYVSVYDSRDGVSEHAAPPTQVHRFSQRNPTDSAYLCETDVSKCVCQQRWSF